MQLFCKHLILLELLTIHSHALGITIRSTTTITVRKNAQKIG